MAEVLIVLLSVLIVSCYGFHYVPYSYEATQCSNGLNEEDYDLDRATVPLEKRSDSDPSTVVSNLSPENLKEFLQKNKDFRYVTLMSRPETTFTPRLGRRKRSLVDQPFLVEEDPRYRMLRYPSNLMRQVRNQDNVKTIHLSSSFTPRLGKKRSGSNSGFDSARNNQPGAITGRSEHVINLNAGNAFTPRMGRSGSKDTSNLH